MSHKSANEVPVEPVRAGSGTVRQVLIGPDEGPNFSMRRFTMEPGGGMPKHTNTVEHEQYVVQGRARVTVGDTVHHVGEGDVLLIHGGTPHSYEVVQAPFEFICVVPNREDQIRLC